MPIAPRARPDDGWLEMCLIRPAGFWLVAGLLPTMLRGRHSQAREVSLHRAQRVEITAPEPLTM